MKVLLLNGSPNAEGCTYTALQEIASVLHQGNIETEIFQAVEATPEKIEEAAKKMEEADGLVIGSPVYWASPSGEFILFMDKFVERAGASMAHKPAAAITSARRAGTTATLDVLHKYLLFYQMPVVSSSYWPMVHGSTPDEVRQDEEGLQIMRTLGRNMAWMLNCIQLGKEHGVEAPGTVETRLWTSFIR